MLNHPTCFSERGKRSETQRRMYLPKQADEFDPYVACLPASLHLYPMVHSAQTLPFRPLRPGTFPQSCNDLASVSLNYNIWNTIIMNSRPHSTLPQLAHTDHLWISIQLLCLCFLSLSLWLFPFHHRDKGVEIRIWWFRWHSQIWSILTTCFLNSLTTD